MRYGFLIPAIVLLGAAPVVTRHAVVVALANLDPPAADGAADWYANRVKLDG